MKASPDASPSTREKIIEAALDLFSRNGFAGTSMRAIAEQVGIRASSLYAHFEGKEAIFSALIESYGPAHSADRLASLDFRALSKQPAEFCRIYAEKLIEQWFDPREQRFMKMVSREGEKLDHQRALFSESLFSREAGVVTDYFRAFQLNGAIKVVSPRETARLFISNMILIRLEHFLMPAAPAPYAAVRQALDRMLDNFLPLIGART